MKLSVCFVGKVDVFHIWAFDELFGSLADIGEYLGVPEGWSDLGTLAEQRNYINDQILILILILEIIN